MNARERTGTHGNARKGVDVAIAASPRGPENRRDWPKMTLRDARVSLIDCDHRTPPAAQEGYPYVAIPQVKEGRLDLRAVRRITRAHYEDWTRKAKPTAHDVVLSRRCNPGETAWVPPGLEFALGQNLVLLRADGTKVFPPFLRWLARSPNWWEQIEKFMNVGAVFDSLRCADVPRFELPVPPLAAQRAIAQILGALDDKIDLNRRMSETLEAMARALFKSWFVDFEPVRAKAEGREPGPAKPVGELFPSAFAESEQGQIPQGWRLKRISDLADVVGGSTPSTGQASFWDGGDVHWATPKDMAPLTSAVLMDTERRITSIGLGQIGSGLLPRGTVLMSSRAPIGYLAIAEVPLAVNQGVIAMIPKAGVPSAFLLRWAEASQEDIVSRANGSTFLEISKGNFRSIPVLDSGGALLREFGRIAGPLHERTANIARESRTLAALRDTLLPKLISGELRIPDAERIVGEVA